MRVEFEKQRSNLIWRGWKDVLRKMGRRKEYVSKRKSWNRLERTVRPRGLTTNNKAVDST